VAQDEEPVLSKHEKLLDVIVRGTSDASIRFDKLCGLRKHLGFVERVRGSHHIFTKDGVEEILNLQPRNGLAKPYQVRQVRNIVLKYRLAGDAD
jgi:hypothetical protein